MVDLSKVVWSTSANTSSSATASLPRPLHLLYAGFYRVRLLWSGWRKAKIYANRNNFYALACGHGLNCIAGDRAIVRMSAIAVVIAHRIMMFMDQLFQMQDRVGKLRNSFRDEYSKVIKYEHVKSSVLSPSTLSEAKWRLKSCIEKIKRIAINLLMIIKDTFVLSMRMIDAIEAFYMSPDTRDQGVNELFVNWGELVDTLEDNQENLQKSLKKCQPIIDEFLEAIGSEFTSERFIELSCETLETVSDVHNAATKVTSPVVKVVQEIGKRLLYGYATFFGLRSAVPKKLHPNYTYIPPDYGPATHFAPDSSITIKN